MTAYPVLPADALQQLPLHAGKVQLRLEKALKGLKRKIVVLDDDPTGVQTVHDAYVYTRWDRETIRDAFRAPEQMFFILTNSRGLTAPESRAQHREIAENLAAVAAETGTDFVLLSRVEELLPAGKSAAVFTRRDRLDLPMADKDRQLQISTEISDALTGVIGRLSIRPSFIVAKGGITSSDVGVKALRVRKALVKGQIRPGIPVWQTGEESRFPGLPYVIFPGNVGAEDDLRRIAETLIGG